MKKIILSTFVFSLLILPLSFVEATTTASTTKPTIEQKIKNKIEEKKQKLSAKKAQQIQKLATALMKKLNKIVDKYDSFVSKLETRILDFENKGVDVSKTKELLLEAQNSVSATKTILTETQIKLDTLLSAEEVSKKDVVDVIKEAKIKIKETHNSLVEVIKSIRANIKK